MSIAVDAVSSEFYAVVDEFPEVDDSIIVRLEDPTGQSAGELLLFIAPRDTAAPGDDLIERLRAALRGQLSPGHVPDRIEVVSAIPRTLTGKRVEAPLKRILRGASIDEVVSRESLSRPNSLDEFAALASRPDEA